MGSLSRDLRIRKSLNVCEYQVSDMTLHAPMCRCRCRRSAHVSAVLSRYQLPGHRSSASGSPLPLLGRDRVKAMLLPAEDSGSSDNEDKVEGEQ